ncbi:unnamed protein product [Sympodiomycopsis kandeliae]
MSTLFANPPMVRNVDLNVGLPTNVHSAQFPGMSMPGPHTRPFFQFTVHFFENEMAETRLATATAGQRAEYIWSSDSVEKPAHRCSIAEWVAPEMTMAELCTTMATVLGKPWQPWTLQRSGSWAVLSQERAFATGLTLSAFARKMYAATHGSEVTVVLTLSDEPDTKDAQTITLQKALESMTLKKAVDKRKVTTAFRKAKSPASPASPTKSPNRTNRKGDASKEFAALVLADRRQTAQADRQRLNVPGNVLWQGRGNFEGAHILPDALAGTTFSEIMKALGVNFLPLLTDQSSVSMPASVKDKMEPLIAGLKMQTCIWNSTSGLFETLREQHEQTVANDIIPLTPDAHRRFDAYQWYASPLSLKAFWITSEGQCPALQSYYANGGPTGNQSLAGWSKKHQEGIRPSLLAASSRCVFEKAATAPFGVAIAMMANNILQVSQTPIASGQTTPQTSSMPESSLPSKRERSSSVDSAGPSKSSSCGGGSGGGGGFRGSEASGKGGGGGNEASDDDPRAGESSGGGQSSKGKGKARESQGQDSGVVLSSSSTGGLQRSGNLFGASSPLGASSPPSSPPRVAHGAIKSPEHSLRSLLSQSELYWLNSTTSPSKTLAALALWKSFSGYSRQLNLMNHAGGDLWDLTVEHGMLRKTAYDTAFEIGLAPQWIELQMNSLAETPEGPHAAMDKLLMEYRDCIWGVVWPRILSHTTTLAV